MKKILSLILVMSMFVVACGNKEVDNETKSKKVLVKNRKWNMIQNLKTIMVSGLMEIC